MQDKSNKSGYVVDDNIVDGYGNLKNISVTQGQAIKRFCWECQGGHEHPWRMMDGTWHNQYRPTPAVMECPSTTCWLYPFRTGRNPRKAPAKNISR